jgi:thiol-disulfide isomerase/thioredoxin
MKSILTALLLLATSPLWAQQTPAIKAADLMHRLQQKDTIYIVNFWATWCAPCIEELPEFDELQKRYHDQPVKVLLVSIDYKRDYEIRLDRFVAKRKIQPEVLWLKENNPNKFLLKLDRKWQGTIPATLIVNAKNQYSYFIEGVIEAPEIEVLVNKQLAL